MSEKDFDELCEKITAQVGGPIVAIGEKQQHSTLNQHFFARFAAAEYNPVYEMSEKTFYLYSSDTGLWEPQDEPAMLDLLSLMMLRFAQKTG